MFQHCLRAINLNMEQMYTSLNTERFCVMFCVANVNLHFKVSTLPKRTLASVNAFDTHCSPFETCDVNAVLVEELGCRFVREFSAKCVVASKENFSFDTGSTFHTTKFCLLAFDVAVFQ